MIRSADLFFTRSNELFSLAVQFRTWGKYSHVEIIVATEPELVVISADALGVTCRDVREEEKKTYEILTCPEITEEQREHVVKFCFSQIGKPYDFMGLGSFLLYKEMQQDSRWFCSELAYVAYKQAGIRLQRRVKQDFVSPRDLYISPLLKPVDEKTSNQ